MMTATERDIPGVIAPPPLLALGTLVLGLIIDWLFPAYVLVVLLTLTQRIVIGVALVAAGAALGIAGERTFKRAGTNVPPWRPALRLVTDGVYRRIRNPMYVGLGLIIAGFGFGFASDWTLALLVAFALTIHYGVVKREERYLEARFGAAYRDYRERVPRYGWPG